MATVTIRYAGVEGTGKNITEAKQDAVRNIESALSGDYTPYFLRLGMHQALIWREPETGWVYRVIGDASGFLYSVATAGDFKSALAYAKYHIAQNAWNGANDEECLTFVGNIGTKERTSLSSWILWQRRYAQSKADGATDDEAREYAGKAA